MAWTYSGDPSSSPKDEIRFLVGDTNSADPQLQDAEINYTIGLVYGSSPVPPSGNYLSAAYCADAIAVKYARQADQSVGDLHISYGQRQKQFLEMGKILRMRATIAGVPVYAGGQSRSAKAATYQNPDLIRPAVVIDGMDDPGTQPGGFQQGFIGNQTTEP